MKKLSTIYEDKVLYKNNENDNKEAVIDSAFQVVPNNTPNTLSRTASYDNLSDAEAIANQEVACILMGMKMDE
ncbi:MAG: hypothetical protein AB8B66_01575 [Rickettsiaceae bacterium]